MIEMVHQMGVLGWPLVVLSVLAGTLILNRIIFFTLYSGNHDKVLERFYAANNVSDIQKELDDLPEKHALSPLVDTLLANRKHTKALRDETISHMLSNMERHFETGLRSLKLLSVISPMMGLLGTVLGMITAFHSIAGSTNAVTPSLIADGLWVAMLTTAYGLAIALPCLLTSHLCARATDRRIASFEAVLNHLSLLMEGAVFPRGKQ